MGDAFRKGSIHIVPRLDEYLNCQFGMHSSRSWICYAKYPIVGVVKIWWFLAEIRSLRYHDIRLNVL